MGMSSVQYGHCLSSYSAASLRFPNPNIKVALNPHNFIPRPANRQKTVNHKKFRDPKKSKRKHEIDHEHHRQHATTNVRNGVQR
jgi:hypothetical protein